MFSCSYQVEKEKEKEKEKDKGFMKPEQGDIHLDGGIVLISAENTPSMEVPK